MQAGRRGVSELAARARKEAAAAAQGGDGMTGLQTEKRMDGGRVQVCAVCSDVSEESSPARGRKDLG